MKFFLLLLFYGLNALSLFAQDASITGMSTLAENIVEIMRGPFVRTILVMCLCGSAIAYGFNKDNEKIKRNCIAIAIAIGIVIGSTEIVNAIWNASGGTD
jgi:type IV secretory pathway VirB2 component (pilin)